MNFRFRGQKRTSQEYIFISLKQFLFWVKVIKCLLVPDLESLAKNLKVKVFLHVNESIKFDLRKTHQR